MKFENKKTIFFFLLFIFIAIVLRIFFYFLAPNKLIDSDNAIVGLMAKHILQGEFPVFFYGQPYMGGLEAYVAAMLYLVFGMNVYALALSPIIHSILFIATTYLLAKEFCGEKKALWAMAYVVFAPVHLMFYGNIARGGYPGTLLWGNLMLLLAVKTVKIPQRGGKKALSYFLLGIVTGLGWWTNSLIIYYILGTAIFLLLAERLRLFFINAICGLTGFFVGSIPFWIYNIKHNFASFQITGTLKIEHIKPAFQKLIQKDLTYLFCTESNKISCNYVDILTLLFYSFCTIYFIIYTIPGILKFFYKRHISTDGRELMTIFCLSLLILYLLSHFALLSTERYLLPLFSFIPVAIAWSLYKLPEKISRLCKFLLILIISFNILHSFFYFWDWRKDCRKKSQRMQNIINELKELGLKRVYAPYSFSQVINFFTNEEIISSTSTNERYRKYYHELEKSNNPAFITKKIIISKFLRTIGGSYNVKTIDNYKIYYSFKVPPYKTDSISPAKWKAWSNYGGDLVEGAFDRSFDELWTSIKPKIPGMIYQLDLGDIYPVCRIRIFNGNHYNNFPTHFRIELSHDSKNWFEAIRETNFDFFSWTGPRIYYWAENWHWDIIFPPKKIRYIRIIQTGNNFLHPWEIKELYVEQLVEEKPEFENQDFWKNRIKQLVDFLIQNDVNFVYADRWLSANIPDMANGKIKTHQPRTETITLDEGARNVIHLTDKTIFIVEETYANETENVLNQLELPFSKHNIAGYSCYIFREPSEGPSLETLGKSLYWTGPTLLKTNFKNLSEIIYQKAIISYNKKEVDEAVKLLNNALTYYPNNFSAIEMLSKIYSQHIDKQVSEKYKNELEDRKSPDQKCSILFKNGVEFLGYSTDKQSYSPGEIFIIKYYWKLKHSINQQISVFVHFSGNGKLFQNDHTFLQQHPHQGFYEPFPNEIFKEQYSVTIPGDLPPGNYEIGIGLFIPGHPDRIKILKTDLPHEDDKAIVGEIVVEEIEY